MGIENIPKVGKIYKFLKAATSLAKSGVKEADILNAAKREFGEVSDLMKLQVRKIFKDKDAPSIKNPNKQPGDVVPFRDKNNLTEDDPMGDLEKIVKGEGNVGLPKKDQASGTIMDRIEGAANRIKEIMKERDAMYKPKQGLDLAEGLTRTITRKILDRKNIEIPRGSDPIEVFSETFGEAIGDVNNLAEELIEIDRRGGSSGSIDDMIQKDGLFDIEIPKNPQRGLTDEEMLNLKKEVDEEKILDEFDPTDRTENSMGGINRIGFADGPDDPDKKSGIMKGLKKTPKIGKIIKGVEAAKSFVNKKLGKDTVTTADKIKQPEKSTQQLISEFEAREKANNEMDALIKDQIEGGFIRDMEKSMQRDMQRELKKPEREILDVPPVPEGFKLSKEKLMAKFPEIDEAFADEMMNMDKDTAGRLIKMLENRRLDPEAYDRLLAKYGDTLQFQKEFDKFVRNSNRKFNAQGGLNYLMGM